MIPLESIVVCTLVVQICPQARCTLDEIWLIDFGESKFLIESSEDTD